MSESHKREDSSEENINLSDFSELIHNLFRDKPVVSMVIDKVYSHKTHHPIEEPGCKFLEQGISPPLLSDSIDNVISPPIALYHFPDKFRRVLHVGVDADYRIA